MMKLGGIKAATDVYDPQTIEERREVAGRCETSLQYGIHTYVDEMDDAVNEAYAAWPTGPWRIRSRSFIRETG